MSSEPTREPRGRLPADPNRHALELIAGTRSVRELARALLDDIEAECAPSQAALYMWDDAIGSCYALSTPPAALGGPARQRMAEVLEAAWSAEIVPVREDVNGAEVLLYPLCHGAKRAGVLVITEASTASLASYGEFTSAAYYLVVSAAQRVERVEAERRSCELEGTRTRLESALADAHEKQRTIEKMAASLERARSELEASHETLEDQVRDRTAELATANASLSEASLRAQASSDAKSRFLAIMSHELRTPLTSILGAAELLANEASAAENELISTVRKAGQDVLGIVSDVLDYSRLESGDMAVALEPFSTDKLLSEVEAQFSQSAASRGLTLDVKSRLLPGTNLQGDRAHIGRILELLVHNAIKYTESGGVRVWIEEHEGVPSIVVSDDGPGIPADVQERVFKAFEQVDTSNARKFEGAGLGLAIARSLAMLVDGTLTLNSTLGVGSEFRLSLPSKALCPQATTPVTATGAEPPNHTTGRVLLVEDNLVNRRIVARLLERLGHEVIEAGDGEQAVACAISGRPDVVLMDIQMPKMDGLEATRRLRGEAGPVGKTPILALTANATPEERGRALDSGMNAFLVKPIQAETLRRAIDESLRAGSRS